MKSWQLAIVGAGLLFLGKQAFADTYLVGALVYASDSSGANVGAYSGTDYQFSTNSSTSHLNLLVDGDDSAISFLLTNGLNTFSFSPESSGYSIDIVGLELFFNSTGTSYNPPYVAGAGVPGDLAAFVDAGSSAFLIPSAGTDVQSYNTNGTSTNAALYGGATTFYVGGDEISIAAFDATSDPSGSFTLDVTPVPEPASGWLLGLGGCCIALWRFRVADRMKA